MKLQILTQRDLDAITTVCDLYSYKNINHLIKKYAATEVSKADDLEVEINSEFLPDTYRYNPSLLASKIRESSPEFLGSSGSVIEGNNKIVIRLFREKRARYQRFHEHPSVKQIIKEWVSLSVNAEGTGLEHECLELPLDIIPAFYASHPEQLAYQVKCETKQRIRIKRLKTLWKIYRKP